MEVKEVRSILGITLERILQHFEVLPGISVYNEVVDITGNPDLAALLSKEAIGDRQGFAFTKDLQDARKRPRTPSVKTSGSYEAGLWLTRPGTREGLRRFGFDAAINDGALSGQKTDQKTVGILRMPFTEFFEGEAKVEDLMFLGFSDHSAYDVYENPIAQAISFNYMSGQMDNENYKLATAYKILKDDPRIVFVSDDGSHFKKELGPQDIPYYNRTDECSRHLPFIYTPTDEEYSKLQAALIKEYGPEKYANKFKMYDMIQKLDLLGLVKGGAVREPPQPVIEVEEPLDD